MPQKKQGLCIAVFTLQAVNQSIIIHTGVLKMLVADRVGLLQEDNKIIERLIVWYTSGPVGNCFYLNGL